MFRRQPLISALTWAGLLYFSSAAYCDTVLLNNGDQLSGKILELNDKSVLIKTDYASTVAVDLAAIRSFATDTSEFWQVRGVAKEVKIVASPTSSFVVIDDELFAIAELSLQQKTDQPKWRKTGHFETSFEIEDKSQHKEKLHLEGEVDLESKRWRHRLRSELKREKEEREQKEDNSELRYTLDYYVNPRWLLRNEDFYRADRMGDNNKYTYVAFGPGYRFWGEGRDKLDLVLTYNHFWLSSNTFNLELNAWAAAVDFKKYYFGERLENFADMQVAVPDFQPIDRIVQGQVGLRYLLTQIVYLSLKYEYSKTEAIIKTQTETNCIFGVGLRF